MLYPDEGYKLFKMMLMKKSILGLLRIFQLTTFFTMRPKMLKKEIAGIVILLLFSLNMAAEKCTEGLTFNGFSGGLVCGQEKLSPKELPLLLRQVPEANELYLQGKNLSKAGMVPLTIGSFALGWGLGVSLFKGPLTSSAGPAFIIGGIGLSIGLPIVAVSIGKTKKAVGIYNEKIKTVALLSMEISVNSIAAVWDF